ncbi:hypothetical protein [Herpetosiphon llansteffanensis]|uniref:hypothetical protein n=1 Tax=Herpetosiphon llansteffanensis TaxID=2094568 RepID=UPI000D7BB78E|nr:hypothetical protein [Herpetosiphon llansteffanensis]
MLPRSTVRRSMGLIIIMMLLTLIVARPQASNAADPPTYYPETGHYLGGGFRDYWAANGGLQIFGYPITEEYRDARGKTIQWFERARFEIASNGSIELGLLGREATVNRVFPQIPPQPNDANHRYFPETSHMVMWGFKTIWETKGGLGVFGYPISEEMDEILSSDNKWHTVQYFERARFEFWPEYPAGQRVVVSDLGRRLAPRELTAPLPPGSPPGSPPPSNPGNKDATVNPSSGPQGTIFVYNGFGFIPGEEVALWATTPSGQVMPANGTTNADADGSLTSSQIFFGSDNGTDLGKWAITAQGLSSGHASVGYFEVTPAPEQPLPADYNARVDPREGRQDTVYNFYASGFVPGELVAVGALNEDGDLVTEVLGVIADGNGSIDYANVYFAPNNNLPPGIYEIYSTSESGREAYAFLRMRSNSVTSLSTASMREAGKSALSFSRGDGQASEGPLDFFKK